MGGGVGIKMYWMEKNRKIKNLGGTIIRDSRVKKDYPSITRETYQFST